MIGFIKTLLLLTVFLLPLITASRDLGYEQIKVLFFIVSISLAGFLWMGKGIKWTKINKASTIFIAILLLTSLFGTAPQSSLLGIEPYYQGLILYVYFFLFSLLVSWSKIKIEHWTYVLVLSGSIVGAIAIKDWVLINFFATNIPTYAGRVVSTFGQPNFYAGFLLLTLPFCYFSLTKPNKGLIYLGMVSGLIALVGILVSYSRSTIILALILLILGLIDQLRGKFKIALIVLVVVFISIFIALRFSSGLVGNEVSKPFLTNNPDLTKESVEKRAYIWPVAWQLILQKSLTGYGLENISQAFSDYFLSNKHLLFEENLKVSPVLISLKELNIDRTHNYILDLLLFSGILGLLTWLLLVIMLLVMLKPKSNDRHKMVLLISLITYLIWTTFQNQGVVHLLYFWLITGLIDQREKLGD